MYTAIQWISGACKGLRCIRYHPRLLIPIHLFLNRQDRNRRFIMMRPFMTNASNQLLHSPLSLGILIEPLVCNLMTITLWRPLTFVFDGIGVFSRLKQKRTQQKLVSHPIPPIPDTDTDMDVDTDTDTDIEFDSVIHPLIYSLLREKGLFRISHLTTDFHCRSAVHSVIADACINIINNWLPGIHPSREVHPICLS